MMDGDTRVRVQIRPGKWAMVPRAMARELRPPRFENAPPPPDPSLQLLGVLQQLAETNAALPGDHALRKLAGLGADSELGELLGDLVAEGKLHHRRYQTGTTFLRVIQLDWCGTILRPVGVPEDVRP